MSLQYRRGICRECNSEQLITNRSKMLCQKHNKERLESGRNKGEKKHSRVVPKKKPTGEGLIFKVILLKRGAKSEISGEFISHPSPINFAHLLAKGTNKYPLFKLREDNICIMTADEHQSFDFGRHEKLKKDPRWNWVFEKIESLKEEYMQLK